MKQFSGIHIVIAAALIALTTDAQVSLETLDTLQNSFICGGQQILKCTIESYSNIMTWTKDTFLGSLAFCSPLGCEVNPSVSGSYNFTFETGNGIFYMEIISVKLSDNDTTYSCDNGSVSATVTSKVTVEDDYNIVKDNKTIDSNTTEVSVTTGCIRDNTAEGLNFEWLFQEVNDTSSEKIRDNDFASVTKYDNSSCLADPDCGVSGYSFITNSVNITDEGVGKKYRIGVVVTFGSIVTTVWFDLIFTLNFPVPESTICNVRHLEIIFAFLSPFLIEMVLCMYFSTYFDKEEMLNFVCCTFWVCLRFSLPFYGKLAKGSIILRRIISGSDSKKGRNCILLCALVIVSLACEVFMILLCKVFCICQWYTLILVVPDLIFRLILGITIIVLFIDNKVSPVTDGNHRRGEPSQNAPSTQEMSRSLPNDKPSTSKPEAVTIDQPKLPPIKQTKTNTSSK